MLANTILRTTLHLQMLYRQLLDQQAATPTILNSGAKSPLTKALVQLAPFLSQTNTISLFCPERLQLSCYRQLLNQQAAPPTILNSGAKSPFTKAFVHLVSFLDQTNPIKELKKVPIRKNLCSKKVKKTED